MNIRPAKAGDIPAIIDLLRQVGQVHHNIRPDIFRDGAQKYDEAALAELLNNPTRPIFVAEEDRVLGYCFCILEETANHPVLTDEKALYIDDLCVDESCRGRHVGKLLYQHVCAFAQALNCNTVTLNVWCGNDSAMAFYEKLGLKPQKIGMEMLLNEE